MERDILREGIIAGVLGAAVVAGWFFVIDLLAREVFYTPAALGSAFFLDATSVEQIEITATTVLGYTAIHLTVFIITGLVAAWVVDEAERQPPFVLAFVLLAVTTVIGFIGLVAIAASWLLAAFAWWSLAIGGLLGALAVAAYLLGQHPGVRAEFSDPQLEERL